MNRPDDEINTTEVKDMVPIVGFLRDSEVFKALNEENLRIKAERLQEGRKKWTTFLQKPKGPVPFCKRDAERLEFQVCFDVDLCGCFFLNIHIFFIE